MTNEELDKICCEFAGIEARAFDLYTEDEFKVGIFTPSGVTDSDEAVKLFHQGMGRAFRPIYPPVSRDGNAMLRLMEALRVKKIYVSLTTGTPGPRYTGYVCSEELKAGGHDFDAETAPMVLALAVASLAKDSKS